MNFDRGLVLQELDRKRVQLHADAAASLHNTDVSQRQRANVSAAVCHCLEAAQGPRAAAAAAVAINAGGRPDGVLQDSDQRTNERLITIATVAAAFCVRTARHTPARPSVRLSVVRSNPAEVNPTVDRALFAAAVYKQSPEAVADGAEADPSAQGRTG